MAESIVTGSLSLPHMDPVPSTREVPAPDKKNTPWSTVLKNTAYIVGTLFIFLFSLDLMISSLQHLGANVADAILMATSNPFTALFIGLLVTAILQSSSATTSMVVALVSSGALTLEAGIPIIMGANVGTTITSTIVSLGFITKKKEFRRAVAAGTYHDFFNILTVLILFPLEYYYGFLSGVSQRLAEVFFHPTTPLSTTGVSFLGSGLGSMISQLVAWIGNGLILIVLSFALLFGSVLLFRRMITNLLGLSTQERVKQYFFKSGIQSFGWGLLITAAIRSSTVTTSLVVPLVAKKVVKLKGAVPFILGANIGTTITAFIAAMSNSNIAISIALAHFLFNFIGVLIFVLVPYGRELPVRLAKGLGELTMKYRLAGFLYILLTFFFIPFSLIYLNKNAASVTELTYQADVQATGSREYRIVCRAFRNQPLTTWTLFNDTSTEPSEKWSVYRKADVLIINDEVFELNRIGYCRTGEDDKGQYHMCIRDIQVPFRLGEITADSAYVFEKQYADSSRQTLYISAADNLVLKRSLATPAGDVLESHTITRISRR
jgi:sodium-dependent phosphate cotransporter